jgi:hypothetical protein
MKRSNIVIIIAASIGSVVSLFLIWKFVVVPLVAIIAGHTVETAVAFFLILLLIGIMIWYLGFERPKILREDNKFLRSVLDEHGITCYTDIRGAIRWGTNDEILKWREDDQKEKELDNYCDILIDKIKEFNIDKRFDREDPYKQQLRGHLAKEYPQSKVEVQTDDARPDIEIDKDKIAIEVKGPTTTAALSTLYEKCKKYSRYYRRVVFVLFEPEYNEDRYEHIKHELEEEYGDCIRFVPMKKVVEALNGKDS